MQRDLLKRFQNNPNLIYRVQNGEVLLKKSSTFEQVSVQTTAGFKQLRLHSWDVVVYLDIHSTLHTSTFLSKLVGDLKECCLPHHDGVDLLMDHFSPKLLLLLKSLLETGQCRVNSVTEKDELETLLGAMGMDGILSQLFTDGSAPSPSKQQKSSCEDTIVCDSEEDLEVVMISPKDSHGTIGNLDSSQKETVGYKRKLDKLEVKNQKRRCFVNMDQENDLSLKSGRYVLTEGEHSWGIMDSWKMGEQNTDEQDNIQPFEGTNNNTVREVEILSKVDITETVPCNLCGDGDFAEGQLFEHLYNNKNHQDLRRKIHKSVAKNFQNPKPFYTMESEGCDCTCPLCGLVMKATRISVGLHWAVHHQKIKELYLEEIEQIKSQRENMESSNVGRKNIENPNDNTVLDEIMSKKQKTTKNKFAPAIEVSGDQITPATLCQFCHQAGTKDILQAGRLYKLNADYYHYFCLLFSKFGVQRGEDEEGINGFLPQDIKEEVKRGKSLICDFCHKTGATIPCSKKGCTKKYHFPCGALKAPEAMMFQFIGQFESFCASHCPKQTIKKEGLRDTHIVGSPSGDTCVICLETSFVDPPPGPAQGRLVSPCCGRTFHRDCIQKTAITAGKATFKCPTCQDKTRFCDEMEKYGIYIPCADAEWEMPQDSNFYDFDEMLSQYRRCDADECSCPRGRKSHRAGTMYEIVRCETCGQNGMHIECGKLSNSCPEYVCEICKNTESSDKDTDGTDDEAIGEDLKHDEEKQKELEDCIYLD